MSVISQRLQERDENWRLCYKALLLLEFLCKQGPLVGVHSPCTTQPLITSPPDSAS